MKKINLLLLSIFTLIASCKKPMDETATEPVKKHRAVDSLLTALEKQFPKYESNPLILQKMDSVFKSTIHKMAEKNKFSDIPMKILRISANPHGKGAIVHFYSDTDSDELLSDRLQFDYIAFTDKSLAETLNEGSSYKVSAKNIHILNKDQVFAIVPQVYFTPETKIEPGTFSSDRYVFNAGVYYCEAVSVSAGLGIK